MPSTLATRSAFAVATLASCAAGAAPRTPAPIPPPTPDAVTHHTLVLDGRSPRPTPRAPARSPCATADDQPTARVFYTAYTLDGANPSKRAVTFFYNGGPGSSTMWLRMGSFGPVRVPTADGKLTGPPPYRVVDNPLHAARPDRPRLHRHAGQRLRPDHRRRQRAKTSGASTKTSRRSASSSSVTSRSSTAGTRRAFSSASRTARCARRRSRSISQNEGISLNGIVLLSSFLNSNIDYNDGAPIGGGDWAYILYLPTEAATAWYHHVCRATAARRAASRKSRASRSASISTRLAKARSSPRIATTTSSRNCIEYTGLSESYIRNSNLRIPYDRFENELLRERGMTVGRIDSRFETYVLDRPESLARLGCDRCGDRLGLRRRSRQLLSAPGARYQTPLLYRGEIYDLIYADGRDLGFQARHQRSGSQRHARSGPER